MQWITDPEALVGLLTLTLLEIVLGIDNIVFISILAGRLPVAEQSRARNVGLVLAVIPRVLLLFFIGLLMRLTTPWVTLRGAPADTHNPWAFSGKDLILLIGGLFLIGKAVKEIHDKLEGAEGEVSARAGSTFAGVITQIMLLNVVFSIDSVITAVGMVDEIGVMVAAVLLSTVLMLAIARPVGAFVERHPTVKVLALSFLVLIGVNLLAEGFGQHIPKGYTYFAMAFAFIVEVVNLRLRKPAPEPVHLHKPVT